jgi:hypothetical protein
VTFFCDIVLDAIQFVRYKIIRTADYRQKGEEANGAEDMVTAARYRGESLIRLDAGRFGGRVTGKSQTINDCESGTQSVTA